MEAVELRGFVPQGDNPASFGVAIAILILDDFLDGERDQMQFRRGQDYFAAYRALPEAQSRPILTGLKALELE